MSSNERISKFLADSLKLLDEKNINKIIKEVANLSKWLQKHQYDKVTDASKGVLLTVVQKYVKFGLNLPDTRSEVYDSCVDKILELSEDICKLPEGKLVSGKSSKTKAMKWIESLRARGSAKSSKSSNSERIETKTLDLIDVDKNSPIHTLTLMDENGDTFDVKHLLEEEIITAFESENCEINVIVEKADFSNVISVVVS